VEGGPTLASAFLAAGLVDEVHVSMGPILLGGPKTAVGDLGITTMAEALHLEIRDVLRFQDDLMVVARVQHEGEK
jgi:diaminohydroxyphosphoribosylaminopyrimidine deaminase/5-amino-6-(5-phosphoribosylamino)uracil reductase